MTVFIKSTPEGKKLIFNAIKAKVIKHLEELEAKESGELKKTFSELKGLLLKGGKGLPVGTVREWKGKKFIKVGPGKWKPKYESETRGAKLAVSALKKKIAQCEDAHEMMQIMIDNKDRFSDEQGEPLLFVQQLGRFIDETQESAHKKAASAGGGGGDGGWPPDEKNKGQAARLREKFNKITDKYVGKMIKNEATGIEAVFSKESQKEIRSRTQNTKDNGFSIQEHFEVANQVIKLFKEASLENTHDDIKNNKENVKIERFLSKEIGLQSGKKVQACITVKHSLDKNGRTIYSLETMDIKNALEKTRAKGQRANAGLSNNLIIPKLEEKSSNRGADFMQSMNAALEPGASGQADIFFGDVETKDAVLKRMLNLKKSLSAIFSQSLATLQSFYEDKLKEYIVKAFTEAEHPRDEKGRFSNKRESSIAETETEQALSNKELKNAVFDIGEICN